MVHLVIDSSVCFCVTKFCRKNRILQKISLSNHPFEEKNTRHSQLQNKRANIQRRNRGFFCLRSIISNLFSLEKNSLKRRHSKTNDLIKSYKLKRGFNVNIQHETIQLHKIAHISQLMSMWVIN